MLEKTNMGSGIIAYEDDPMKKALGGKKLSHFSVTQGTDKKTEGNKVIHTVNKQKVHGASVVVEGNDIMGKYIKTYIYDVKTKTLKIEKEYFAETRSGNMTSRIYASEQKHEKVNLVINNTEEINYFVRLFRAMANNRNLINREGSLKPFISILNGVKNNEIKVEYAEIIPQKK